MPGVRRIREITEDTVKLSILIPEDLDRQLRALAVRRGMAVGPMVREWITYIIEQTDQTGTDRIGS